MSAGKDPKLGQAKDSAESTPAGRPRFRDKLEELMVVTLHHYAEEMKGDANFTYTDIVDALQGCVLDIQTLRITAMIKEAAAAGTLATAEAKQSFAKMINAECRRTGQAIGHPDDKEPCILVGINDKYGGKFVLENRRSKKRSFTTRDITSLLPLVLVPLPKEEWDGGKVGGNTVEYF